MNLKDLIVLLKTAITVDEIDKRRDDIEKLIPTVKIMFDYDQHNIHHQYNLWMHSLHTVINLPRNMVDDMIYLGALLHDIGKPSTQCRSNRTDDKAMHYYGHQEKGCMIIEDIVIPELKRSGELILDIDQSRLLYYVLHHDDRMSLKVKYINRHMKLTESWEEFRNLMYLQVADARAHVLGPNIKSRIEVCSAFLGEEGDELYKSYLSSK